MFRVVRLISALFGVAVLASACASRTDNRADEPDAVSMAASQLPTMRWDHRPEADEWTRATLAALNAHGANLLDILPSDIMAYCPRYPSASRQDRAAFWVGIMSALAKHESTWRPEASGGGGLWIGLTQIDPRTAVGYDCNATTSAQLKDGAANLSCAVRIASAQVGKDQALVSDASGNWRGLARDWAPFRSQSKRDDMAQWTRNQDYCANG